ncbi:hypothetical protein RhiirC2_772805 [Rhizophagus irregularis]|uniref:F-box domain-containing protein n=1 Tax=Rhizophagus irregularis TaxID=588596 RepID=A0A2N1NQL2_9GLOM|nr:hypothetical protein RhiirC2_772805 [Rhizophagus irregularis]
MLGLESSQTQYFQTFENFVDEIKINIFKYVNHPLNLTLTCRKWSIVVKDPYAKTEWLIVKYGKAHALFQAIGLGPTFIDMALCQVLIERKVITSKFFIQILLKYFGNNQKLFSSDKIHAFRQKIKSTYLLNERYNQSVNNKRDLLYSKGNEVQLIRTFIATHHINHTSAGMLSKKNFNYIEDLISQLIGPSRSKSLQMYFNGDFNIRQSHKYGAIRFFGESFSRSLTVLPVFINNVGILGAQPLRNVNQRRWNRLQRYRNRYARFNGPINNEDTLNRIARLPIQQIRNEPLIDQFFNGSPFI